MSRLFVTSDTHFGHTNIIKYCNRPFTRVEDMIMHMMMQWAVRVNAQDDVYFLGDFAMGPGATEDAIVEWLFALKGRKHFILGNHDQKSKYSKGLRRIIEDNRIIDCRVIDDQIYELPHDGKKFVMCHFPMAVWDGKHHGAIHLHGHTHTQFSLEKRNDMIAEKRYDVGVDMYGGPVELTGDLRYLNSPKGWN